MDEQSIYWEDYRGETPSGGGHAPLPKAEAFLQPKNVGEMRSTKRRVFSWRGTYDHVIAASTETESMDDAET